jgi:hypothetical protein
MLSQKSKTDDCDLNRQIQKGGGSCIDDCTHMPSTNNLEIIGTPVWILEHCTIQETNSGWSGVQILQNLNQHCISWPDPLRKKQF